MARRSALERDSIRRSNGGAAAGGVTSISINGGPAISGAINLRSPMALDTGGASPIRIDNGNVAALVDAAPIVGIDADLNNSFQVTITAARVFSIPTNSITGAPRNGEKLTFSITQGGAGLFTPTWTGGAAGYAFANAASPEGITLAQHNALASVTPAGSMYQVAFEYHAGLDRYVCNGLGGYWL